MQHVALGRTGLMVSRLMLGTATFGVQCDEDASCAVLDRADELGITFIDTADKYPLGGSLATNGRTEQIVGRWLRGRRDRYILASKFHGRMGPSPWDAGASRKHVMDAVDGSLRRLGTDYLDLYQIHRPDPVTPIEETLGALDDLVRAGKIRYVGCSNFLAYQVALALGRSDLLRLVRFATVQPRYNLLFREIERELLPLAAQESLAVLPYNLLAGGLLSGKHSFDAGPSQGTRFTLGTAAGLYQDRYWNERSFEALKAMSGLAAATGLPVSTMAVAWVMANPVVTSAIVGASRPEQLDAVVSGASTALERTTVQRLDEITHEFRFGDAVE